MTNLKDFYKGKKVFITGHTGFKGSWLCRILFNLGTELTGYALSPLTSPSLFDMCGLEKDMHSVIADIRDLDNIAHVFNETKPEIVIHMAAQPLVGASYTNPVYTYETNVMGTVNVLECVRRFDSVKSFLNVTTDKVYKNNEWEWGYRETDPLDGYDPYSNSKSCSELVTHSYKSAFFADQSCAISTARAGNVIGGGDFSANRIIPDCVRAAQNKEKIHLRNPHSVRPYQHVLEPLFAYLMIVEKQYNDNSFADYYNVGPDDIDCVTTGKLAELFCQSYGDGLSWESGFSGEYHEAGLLKLDCARLKSKFGWHPQWNVSRAIDKTVEWTKAYFSGINTTNIMDAQINEYMKGFKYV